MNIYEKSAEEAAQLGQTVGAKFDSGKARWDLIPADVMVEVAVEYSTFHGLHQMERNISSFEGKLLFHYSNGMEAAWNFWNSTKSVPISAAVQEPLIFSIISFIHLFDLTLLKDNPSGLSERENIYSLELRETSAFYLMPYRVINSMADIYLYGCKKYDENNWKKGMLWGKIFGAFNRHAGKWFGGEEFDDESGMPHLGHALWQLFGLRWYELYKKDLDDRWNNETLSTNLPQEKE